MSGTFYHGWKVEGQTDQEARAEFAAMMRETWYAKHRKAQREVRRALRKVAGTALVPPLMALSNELTAMETQLRRRQESMLRGWFRS